MTPAQGIVGDDRADIVADHLAEAFDAAQRADAAEIIDWLDEAEALGPFTTSDIATGWDDFDWRLIGEEVGVPTPVGTRNHVLRLLLAAGR